MADQVNPAGSLPSGLPVVLSAAYSAKANPDNGTATPAAQVSPAFSGTSETQLLANPKAREMALSQINSGLQQVATQLKIQVDRGSGRAVYSIVEGKSGHVVLQIPSEEVLAMARNLKALDQSLAGSTGILMDKEG